MQNIYDTREYAWCRICGNYVFRSVDPYQDDTDWKYAGSLSDVREYLQDDSFDNDDNMPVIDCGAHN